MPTKQTKQKNDQSSPAKPQHRPSELALFSRVINAADEKETAFLNRLLDAWISRRNTGDIIELAMITAARELDLAWLGPALIDRPDDLKALRPAALVLLEDGWAAHFMQVFWELHAKGEMLTPEDALRVLSMCLEDFHADLRTATRTLQDHPEMLADEIRFAAAKLEARNA